MDRTSSARRAPSDTMKAAGSVAVRTAGPDASLDVDRMVAAASAAQGRFASWEEDRVDALLHDIAAGVADRAVELARRTVEETGIGWAPDKAE